MKPEINFTPYRVRYSAVGPEVDAVRLSCESRTGFYCIGLTSDGHKYYSVNGRIVPDLPSTPYTAALRTAWAQCVFLLSRYLAAPGERNGLFWEIKGALKP